MLLSTFRAEKGETQDTVAKAIGVQRYTYAKWEQGRAEPSIIDLVKLCKYFECSFEDLVGVESDFISHATQKTKLTTQQLELLNSFNLLSIDDQNKVLGFIKALQ